MSDKTINQKDTIAQLLQKYVANITFVKKDGTERTMKCTLDPAIIVPYDRKTNEREKAPNDAIISVWDVEASGWRSIIVSNILTLELVIE